MCPAMYIKRIKIIWAKCLAQIGWICPYYFMLTWQIWRLSVYHYGRLRNLVRPDEKWGSNQEPSCMTHPSYCSVHLSPLITRPCALMQTNRDLILRGAKECHAQVEAIVQHHVEHHDDHRPVEMSTWGYKTAFIIKREASSIWIENCTIYASINCNCFHFCNEIWQINDKS